MITEKEWNEENRINKRENGVCPAEPDQRRETERTRKSGRNEAIERNHRFRDLLLNGHQTCFISPENKGSAHDVAGRPSQSLHLIQLFGPVSSQHHLLSEAKHRILQHVPLR